jgi:hypothetical protein
VLIARRELPETPQAGVRRKALVVGGEDFDELVTHPHANFLTNRAVGYRIEVLVDLHGNRRL